MEDKVVQYMKAMRDGNAEPLEQLAVSAGYSRSYDGWKVLENARAKLFSSLSTKDADVILADLDSFCDTIMPKMVGEEYRNSREQFGIPTAEDLVNMSPDQGLRYAQEYLNAVQSMTGPIWANKESGFIRTKDGPEPHKNSMVAYVTWVSKGKDGSSETKPENRRFFIDVYNEDPLWEMKLDWGVYTSIHNERADKAARGSKVKPYVYGEADGSGPHVVDFEQFKKVEEHLKGLDKGDETISKLFAKLANLPRDYADGLRISWRTENLIYGEDAIRYLISLRSGNGNGLFPLYRQGYGRLIEHQRENIRELEDEVGHYTPKEIKDLTKKLHGRGQSIIGELDGWLGILQDLESGDLQEEDIDPEKQEELIKKLEAQKIYMNQAKEAMEVIESYGRLQDEKRQLVRLEEAVSRL